MNTYKII